MFVKNTAVNIGSFHIAPTQPIAVIARKIKHKHIQKESTFPLPLITSLRPPRSSLPLEAIQLLATRSEAWQAIPESVKLGSMDNKTRLYTSICSKTPRFGSVVSTSVQHNNAHVLRAAVMSLLVKGPVETVCPAQSMSGFYTRYLLVPKMDGGLRPILDLRYLNHALMKQTFRMITSKQILLQICPGDWFFLLDLKDACIHIQIAPPPQVVLEIHLQGSGLSKHGPPLWAVPGFTHFYEVHGCGSFPAETDGNPHPELPQRLAHFGQVRGRASISQMRDPQLLIVSRTQG